MLAAVRSSGLHVLEVCVPASAHIIGFWRRRGSIFHCHYSRLLRNLQFRMVRTLQPPEEAQAGSLGLVPLTGIEPGLQPGKRQYKIQKTLIYAAFCTFPGFAPVVIGCNFWPLFAQMVQDWCKFFFPSAGTLREAQYVPLGLDDALFDSNVGFGMFGFH